MLPADRFCCFLFMWLSLDERATDCILATCAFLIAMQVFLCFFLCPQLIKSLSPVLLSSIKIVPVQKAKVLSVESCGEKQCGNLLINDRRGFGITVVSFKSIRLAWPLIYLLPTRSVRPEHVSLLETRAMKNICYKNGSHTKLA